MATAKILIVDDEADLRTIIRAKLEGAGFEIREAADGKQALDMLQKDRPDLVIMDVKMPVMNGVEAVSAMKADENLRDIKVVFLTNYGEEEVENAWIDEKYAKEIGALGHIRKTDDLSVIVGRIKELVGA
ncbi:MAG TPA: response regulator [Candidatus Paceibacterota bacterium]|nr:response regulator [Candidatus Paceibacterota bacterium]